MFCEICEHREELEKKIARLEKQQVIIGHAMAKYQDSLSGTAKMFFIALMNGLANDLQD